NWLIRGAGFPLCCSGVIGQCTQTMPPGTMGFARLLLPDEGIQSKGGIRQVRARIGILSLGLLAFALGAYGQSQSGTTPNPAASQADSQKQGRSAGGDIGSGSGDIGKGAGKGAGDLAKGTGKGAGDLVTAHPIDAAGDVGKGGASAGKDAGVGAAKGTGKVV